MKKYISLFFLFSLIIIGCGPSKEEIQRQYEAEIKQREDVIRQKYEEKAAIEKSISAANTELNELKNTLVETKAQLEVSKDEMNRIKEWQFGRTPSEREEQIRSQSLYIQNLEENIATLESDIDSKNSQIAELNTSLSNLGIDN